MQQNTSNVQKEAPMLAICPVCDKRFDHHEIDNGTDDRLECSAECVLREARAELSRHVDYAETIRAALDEAVALLRIAWTRYDVAIHGGAPGSGLDWSRKTRSFLSRLDGGKVTR